MADIFDAYPMSAAWDEMFARPGLPRPVAERPRLPRRFPHGPPTADHWPLVGPRRLRGAAMPDALFVLATIAFFALALGYAALCDRL